MLKFPIMSMLFHILVIVFQSGTNYNGNVVDVSIKGEPKSNGSYVNKFASSSESMGYLISYLCISAKNTNDNE